jgi:hypothetical protein
MCPLSAGINVENPIKHELTWPWLAKFLNEIVCRHALERKCSARFSRKKRRYHDDPNGS